MNQDLRRFKPAQSLKQRLRDRVRRFSLLPLDEREALFRQVRQAGRAAHTRDWPRSSKLKSPE